MHRVSVGQRQGRQRQARQWQAVALAAATAASGLQGAVAWAAPRQPSAQSLPVVPAPQPTPATAAPRAGQAAPAAAGGSVQLKVRRLPDALELVIEGTGSGPQLQQSSNGNSWEGLLTTTQATALRLGPQRLSLPEVGLQTITLDGSGRSYRISVTPMPGYPVGRPVVSADGQNLILSFASAAQTSLQTSRLDMTAPGRVPQPAYAPPLQPRAVAPPLGDMAVGSMMMRNSSFVNVSGPRVTLTLNNAPAKDALMALARIGGYGFVFVDDQANAGNNKAPQSAVGGRTVSVGFNNESYSTALNTVLLAAGLQGKLEGNILFTGSNVLAKGFGPRLSKVYRLNQVNAGSAADYLANLGATITKTNTLTTATTEGVAQQSAVAGGPNAQTTSTSTTTTVEAYGAASGPLIGLQATTDSRLGTITLVGDPSLVAIAEQYLRQLDLRQRQVALSVRILDVTLKNDTDIKNSFAFRYGNNFIVSEEGSLVGAFNDRLPPRSGQFEKISGGADTAKPTYGDTAGKGVIDPLIPAPINPGSAYDRDNFYNLVRAQIVSQNTKVLASPTLILSENPEPILGGAAVASAGGSGGGGGGENAVLNTASIGRPFANESFVTVGTQVITNFTVQAGQNGAPNSCQPEFGTAGLTFGAKISKIDDNGFVTFALSPAVSAVTDTPQQVEGCGNISTLSVRRLDTGAVRVRDGQTLILTGVISDEDRQVVTKWPILGDLPLIGQFFRSSLNNRSKNELVIMVTPRIINDEQGGEYGYGYAPQTPQAKEFMGGQ